MRELDVTVNDFSGGQNDRVDPSAIGDNQSPFDQNCFHDDTAPISAMPFGMSQAKLPAGNFGNGAWNFKRHTGANFLIVSGANGANGMIYSSTDGVNFTPANDGFADIPYNQTNIPEGVAFKDKFFITDGLQKPVYFDGTNWVYVGTCKGTPGIPGLVDAGQHQYAISMTVNGTVYVIGVPSNIVNDLVNSQNNLINIPLGPAIITTARTIYRTKANMPGTFFQLPNGVIMDNTTTTFTDNNADATLVTNMPAINAPVPKAFYPVVHQNRLFMIKTASNPDTFFWTEPDETDLFLPLNNQPLPVESEVMWGGASFYGELMIPTENNIWILMGDNIFNQFQLEKRVVGIGCLFHRSLQAYYVGEQQFIAFLSKRGFYLFDGSKNPQRVSDDIQTSFNNFIQPLNRTGNALFNSQNDFNDVSVGGNATQGGDSTPNELNNLTTYPGGDTVRAALNTGESSNFTDLDIKQIAYRDDLYQFRIFGFPPITTVHANGFLAGLASITTYNAYGPKTPINTQTIPNSNAPNEEKVIMHGEIDIPILERDIRKYSMDINTNDIASAFSAPPSNLQFDISNVQVIGFLGNTQVFLQQAFLPFDGSTLSFFQDLGMNTPVDRIVIVLDFVFDIAFNNPNGALFFTWGWVIQNFKTATDVFTLPATWISAPVDTGVTLATYFKSYGTFTPVDDPQGQIINYFTRSATALGGLPGATWYPVIAGALTDPFINNEFLEERADFLYSGLTNGIVPTGRYFGMVRPEVIDPVNNPFPFVSINPGSGGIGYIPILEKNELVIQDNFPGLAYGWGRQLQPDTNFINANGWEVEANIRVDLVSGTRDFAVYGNDDIYTAGFSVHNNPSGDIQIIGITGGNFVNVGLPFAYAWDNLFHTIRMTVQGVVVNIYIDGSSTPAFTRNLSGLARGNPAGKIFFGCANTPAPTNQSAVKFEINEINWSTVINGSVGATINSIDLTRDPGIISTFLSWIVSINGPIPTTTVAALYFDNRYYCSVSDATGTGFGGYNNEAVILDKRKAWVFMRGAFIGGITTFQDIPTWVDSRPGDLRIFTLNDRPMAHVLGAATNDDYQDFKTKKFDFGSQDFKEFRRIYLTYDSPDGNLNVTALVDDVPVIQWTLAKSVGRIETVMVLPSTGLQRGIHLELEFRNDVTNTLLNPFKIFKFRVTGWLEEPRVEPAQVASSVQF